MNDGKKMREDVTVQSSGYGGASVTNVHIRGFYGDAGESEGVLSVIAHVDMTLNHPAHTAISIGSPAQSPLIPGYIPNLGMFSCSVEGAERLIDELKAAVATVKAGCKWIR
jgi:hypothetical protein